MTLDLARLRAVLLSEPCNDGMVLEDGLDMSAPRTPAAVLFPIVLRDSGPSVLLTQRTAHLKDHPGQISFPGGRVEADDPSPIHTALRETVEEIGLHPEHVEIIGFLPEYPTRTGFQITPVVGLVSPPFELKADAFEVEEIFEVPLSYLLDDANHQRMSMSYQGTSCQYYAMPYGDYFIWGATAGMIRSLFERLHAGGKGQDRSGCDMVKGQL